MHDNIKGSGLALVLIWEANTTKFLRVSIERKHVLGLLLRDKVINVIKKKLCSEMLNKRH